MEIAPAKYEIDSQRGWGRNDKSQHKTRMRVCVCVFELMHTALLPEINRFTQRVDTTQFKKLTKVGAQTSTRRTHTQKITLKISWSILPVWLENSFQIEFYSISNKRTLCIQPFSLCFSRSRSLLSVYCLLTSFSIFNSNFCSYICTLFV